MLRLLWSVGPCAACLPLRMFLQRLRRERRLILGTDPDCIKIYANPRLRRLPRSRIGLIQALDGRERPTMNLLEAWREWSMPIGTPMILDGDEPILEAKRSRSLYTMSNTWKEYTSEAAFGRGNDFRFHLSLIPVPFVGDLERAKIFILLLNPGLEPQDYYGELHVSSFRQRLLDNLAQRFNPGDVPFFCLDPTFSWHSGFAWWNAKLRRIISVVAEQLALTYAQARAAVARSIAAIDLVPYHSESYNLPVRVEQRLRSVQLARDYVQSVLLPRAAAGEVLVVITRKARVWGVTASPGVVVYSSDEARAAHLTPNSTGGKCILEQLFRSYIEQGAESAAGPTVQPHELLRGTWRGTS